MKRIAYSICLALALSGVGAFASILNATETRELSSDADGIFPKRRCVAEFKDGVPDGVCRAYDDKNRLILTEDYVKGRVEGKRVCYYPSGKKFSEMTFVNGLAEGATTTWFEDGTVASVDHMRRGLPNGLQTLYFPNGSRMTETPHVDAVAHGTCRHYLPDGQLFGVSAFENGVQTGRHVTIQPTADEYRQIVERGKFTSLLKDHWPSGNGGSSTAGVKKTSSEIRQGDQVEVEWKAEWYPATVLRIEKRGYLIHYIGFDDSWNEYVRNDRIRAAN